MRIDWLDADIDDALDHYGHGRNVQDILGLGGYRRLRVALSDAINGAGYDRHIGRQKLRTLYYFMVCALETIATDIEDDATPYGDCTSAQSFLRWVNTAIGREGK